MESLEIIGECLKSMLIKEAPKSDLDSRRIAERSTLFAFRPEWLRQNVGSFILGQDAIHFMVSYLFDAIDKISYSIAKDRIAQPDLCCHLVAFCYCYFPHVVAKASDFERLCVVPRTCGTSPCGELVLYILILPKSGDHLAIDAQAASNKSELTVTVRRLVEIHEIHVDRGP